MKASVVVKFAPSFGNHVLFSGVRRVKFEKAALGRSPIDSKHTFGAGDARMGREGEVPYSRGTNSQHSEWYAS